MRVTRTGPKTLARPRTCPASTLPCGLLPCAVEGERGLQQPPLHLAALSPDHVLLLPVVQEPRLARRPGQQPGELLCGIGQRRRQLPVRRDLASVLPDLPYRHRQRDCHRRASSGTCREWFPPMLPETAPEPPDPATAPPPRYAPRDPP